MGLFFGEGGFIPVTAGGDFIEIGAEIGIILLLLMLGLEYSAGELVGNLKTSKVAGLLDMVLNALPGVLLALILGWGPIAAVALGGITWVSSSGVIAKVLQDLGRLTNRETPTMLSILVIEDLAMAFYLPILTALLVGMDLGAGSRRSHRAGAFGDLLYWRSATARVVSKFVGPRTPRSSCCRAGAHAARRGLARSSGGLVGGRCVPGRHRDLRAGGRARRTSAHAAARPVRVGVLPVLRAAHRPGRSCPCSARVLLAVVTMATKVATGYIAARRAGIGEAGRWRAGFALTPRGEFSIVIAGLAVAAGVNASLAALATAYVLITIVLGPILARLPDTQAFKTWAKRRQAARKARQTA